MSNSFAINGRWKVYQFGHGFLNDNNGMYSLRSNSFLELSSLSGHIPAKYLQRYWGQNFVFLVKSCVKGKLGNRPAYTRIHVTT